MIQGDKELLYSREQSGLLVPEALHLYAKRSQRWRAFGGWSRESVIEFDDSAKERYRKETTPRKAYSWLDTRAAKRDSDSTMWIIPWEVHKHLGKRTHVHVCKIYNCVREYPRLSFATFFSPRLSSMLPQCLHEPRITMGRYRIKQQYCMQDELEEESKIAIDLVINSSV